jgi:glutaredoxin
MKLYVCHTTKGPDLHPCAKAYRALEGAGHKPEVVVVRGTGRLPRQFDPITKTDGRAKVEALTGDIKVPALDTDDGEGIGGCQNIIDWAKAHPGK